MTNYQAVNKKSSEGLTFVSYVHTNPHTLDEPLPFQQPLKRLSPCEFSVCSDCYRGDRSYPLPPSCTVCHFKEEDVQFLRRTVRLV